MKPRPSEDKPAQPELFRQQLELIIDTSHPMVTLAHQIDWESFNQTMGATYCEHTGRPGLNTRLMVSLHYLKYAYNLSDESTVAMWVENPYWQYLSGMNYFEHKLPIDPSSMTRWRQRHGEQGGEELLKQTITTALKQGHLKANTISRVNIDTTVGEKNISYPTDSKLYVRSMQRLVKEARRDQLTLRQTYSRVAKKQLLATQRYAHAKQMKRAQRSTKKLRTMLGRLVRDIMRKSKGNTSYYLGEELQKAQQLLTQTRHSKDKLYSLHQPQVHCISKGKAHKRYEFGNKVSLAVTTQHSWIVGCFGLPGNPYDGHTLEQTVERTQTLTGIPIQEIFVDRGYCKQEQLQADLHIDRARRGKIAKRLWRAMKHRAAIEPVIGHLKTDHRMRRNYLSGTDGDMLNPVLAAAGYNFRKLLKLLCALFALLKLLLENQKSFSKQLASST